MKSDWEKLFEEWKSHPVGLVAEVDCTEAEDLCEEYEVTEYPTLFFGDPTAPEIYEGKTDYESLSEFAKKNLRHPICSVYNIDGCSEVDKMIISEMEAKTLEDLSMDLSEVEKLAEDEEEKLEFKIDELEEQYENLISSYNEKVEEIRINRHYNLVREILRIKLEKI
jgi:Thioredoxin